MMTLAPVHRRPLKMSIKAKKIITDNRRITIRDVAEDVDISVGSQVS